MNQEQLNEVESNLRAAVSDLDASGQTIYACAIDAGSAYLNSLEHLASQGEVSDRLRWGTGDFKFGEIAELVDYDVYDEHYNMNADEQKTSEYAGMVAAIITHIEANRDSIFEGLQLSDDFRLYAAAHEY